MFEVRPSVPKTEDHAYIMSRLLIKQLDIEEFVQEVWNTRFEQPPSGVPIDPFDWITGATAATAQGSSVTSFADEDTATEFRTLEKNDARVADLIQKIRFTQAIPDRESIAQRLFELLQDVKEEPTESVGISTESLRSFYKFLQIHSSLKRPAIGLTPINDIYVSWKGELDSVFSIHFLSSGFVRFVVIAPNQRNEQLMRLSGTANVESLVEKVRPWGVLKWAGREGR